MYAESEMRGSPHLGRFILLSIVLHLVGMVFAVTIPLKREQTEPVIYTVGIVEAPEPPPPVIREPAPAPRAPSAGGAVRVPPPKIERAVPKEAAPPLKEAMKEAVEKAPPPAPERALEPPEEVAALPTLPGPPEAPPVPAVPGREGVPGGKAGVPGAEKPTIPRDSIFDRDVVRMFAKKEESPAIVKPEDTITFDTKEFKYKNYMERLRETIEGIWEYPRSASAKGIYGDLIIEFVIKKNGKLGSVRVMRTSGYSDLDEAAVKALRDAEPYIWPFPEGWDIDVMNIRGHFVYTIYGMQIR